MVDPERGDPGVCGGQVEVFLEPVMPSPVLVVVGGGHVGKAVAHLASWLGFHVVVTDDRPEFASQEAVPDGDEFYPLELSDLSSQFDITPWTYVVLTTRGVDVDVAGLPSLLDSQAAYIGVIGSKRRWTTTRKKLTNLGVSDDKLERVFSPVGLEINAETPEEIAVSIMAEIIMHQRGGHGRSMNE